MKKTLQSNAPLIGGLLIGIVLTTLVAMNIIGRIAPIFAPSFARPVSDSADPLVSKVGQPLAETQPTLQAGDFVRGDQSAPVKIFEFSDFSCPYCATMASTLTAALAKHKDVALVWRDFPVVSVHPNALDADIAANCAGAQGKFWEYHDQLFANQSSFSRDYYMTLASQLSLKTEAFSACLDGQTPLPSIEQHINEGNSLGIDGTPYLFVDDQRISGQLSAEELEQVIQQHLLEDTKK